jgi:nucleoside-diphosphate-sugar epimerase
MPPAHVLVTGAAGRIGRATTELLMNRGIRVTALTIQHDQPIRADRVLVGDATDPAAVAEALEGVDAVVHLAAIPHRDAGKPYDVYRTNVTSTFNVLSQAGEHGIRRAVIASSINAFGVPMNHHDVAPAYFPIDEQIPADIDDWYSLSKQSDELTAQMVARRWGVDVAALRFPIVESAAALLRTSALAELDPATRMREGWSYLDLRDAAEVIYRSLIAEWTGAVVVGLSAADTLMARPTAELLRQYAPGVELHGQLAGRDPLIDTSRARDILGFTPRYSVHDERPDERFDERFDA